METRGWSCARGEMKRQLTENPAGRPRTQGTEEYQGRDG